MSLDPDTERLVEERIRRLGPGPRRAAGRAELKDHVLQALESDAKPGRPATPAAVDEAFASLGSDEEIRKAFFHTVPRPRPSRAVVVALAACSALAALAILLAPGPSAACAASAAGSASLQPLAATFGCRAAVTSSALDLVLYALPPLAALAALHWLPGAFPRWSALVVAAPYAAVCLLRAAQSMPGRALSDSTLVVAGLATVGACAWHAWRPKGVAA